MGARSFRWWSVVVLVVVLVQAGCAAKSGFYHRVAKGETLYRISKAYDVDIDRLAKANNLHDKGYLRTGQYLLIPGDKRSPSGSTKPPSGTFSQRRRAVKVDHLRGRFAWPLKGKVNRSFGRYKKKRHSGIDILAKTGTTVRAIAGGEVIYAGSGIKGSGETVIMRHFEEIFSVTSHLGAVLVKKGQSVKKGEAIATVGPTKEPHMGQSGAFVHLEIRERTIAVNPENLLP